MTAKARGKDKVVLFDDSTRERPQAKPGRRDVRSIAHLKLLQSLAGKLNRLNDVREIGHAIAAELRMLIDYHSCRVFVRDGDELIPVSHIGDLRSEELPLAQVLALKVGEGITGHVAETGESMLVHDALNCEYAVVLPGTEEVDESLAAVPLKFGTRVIGVLVISKLGLNQFDADDVRLLEVLAGHASVALENARLYDVQRREAESAKALLEFSDALARATTLEGIAEEAVAAVERLFGAVETCLWLRDERARAFTCVASRGRSDAHEPCVPVTIEEGEAFVAGRSTPFLAAGAPGIAPTAPVAVAPLQPYAKVPGWLAAVLPEPPTEDRLRLLNGLTDQAGAALERARLSHEQRLAAEIANALLEFSRQLVRAEGMQDVLARIVAVDRRDARLGPLLVLARERQDRRARGRDAVGLSRRRGGCNAPRPLRRRRRRAVAGRIRAVPASPRRPRPHRRRPGGEARPDVRRRAGARRRWAAGLHRGQRHRRGRLRRAQDAAARRSRAAGAPRDRECLELRAPGGDVRLDGRGARERAGGERRGHVLACPLDPGRRRARGRGARSRRPRAEAARARGALPRHRQDRRSRRRSCESPARSPTRSA